jgi:hypothetical protein
MMHGITGPCATAASPGGHKTGEKFDFDAIPARVRDIAALRGLGYSFREIGRQFGQTPQAISVMLQRHRRSLKSLKIRPELHQLSARAVNVLGRHGIRSRADCEGLDLPRVLDNERNCGRKTKDEIFRWLEGGGR